jgi:hypothetical protein
MGEDRPTRIMLVVGGPIPVFVGVVFPDAQLRPHGPDMAQVKNAGPIDLIALTQGGTCFGSQHATIRTGRWLLTVWIDGSKKEIGTAAFSLS